MTKVVATIGLIYMISISYGNITVNHNERNPVLYLFNSFQTKKKSKGSTVQCKAISKSTKSRCKNKTSNSSGYCRVHGG